jgi:hypothetical protein
MALPNDSVAITPGSGTTIASHLISGKEYQTVIVADADGHLQGGRPTFAVSSQNTANVAAARTTFIDLFNATGSGIKIHVCGVYVIPALAAVAGVGLTWEIIRTSAVGTGGTTATPQTFDTENGALPGQVTARTKPTGGATTAATLLYVNSSSEETNFYAGTASSLNHIPQIVHKSECIVLNEGQGVKVDQTTNSSVGSTNVVIVFNVV